MSNESAARRETRTSQAYRAITDKLMRLEYGPGDSLTEAEVAKDLALTKTPVREALLMLSADNLVIARPGSGYRVSPITMRSIRELCAHWLLIETAAVAGACARGLSDFDVLDVQEAMEKMAPDPHRAHTQTHHLLVDYSDAYYLWREWQRLQVEIERLLRFTLPAATTADLSEHMSEVFAAIIRSDAPAATEALTRHIRTLERAMIEGVLSSDALVPLLFEAPDKATHS